jgi:hypothetical protein
MSLQDDVVALYERNRQRGRAAWCGLDYDFVCPSASTYPFQWFWDSCFHAVVLAHIDVERARGELVSLLANQQQDGFVAHVTFWQRERYEKLLSTYDIAYRTPHLSDCMQPPLLAEAIAAVAANGGRIDDLVPKAVRYYDWLHAVRDPDDDGLVAVLQADETGLDQCPKFDPLMGVTDPQAPMAAHREGWHRVADPYAKVGRDPKKMFDLDLFVVEDVMVNTIYAHNTRLLARLSGEKRFAERSRKTINALIDKCWDEEAGLFFDLSGKSEEKLRTSTFTSLMPLLLHIPKDIAARLAKHFDDDNGYKAPFPVPTVPRSSPAFNDGSKDARLVWRGPTWINASWYLARGLRKHGYEEKARRIEDANIALVEKSGFREFYNPLTGEGYGAQDFSWSALVLDMVTRPT